MRPGAGEHGQALAGPAAFYPEAYAERVQARDWYEDKSVRRRENFLDIGLGVLAIQKSSSTWPATLQPQTAFWSFGFVFDPMPAGLSYCLEYSGSVACA